LLGPVRNCRHRRGSPNTERAIARLPIAPHTAINAVAEMSPRVYDLITEPSRASRPLIFDIIFELLQLPATISEKEKHKDDTQPSVRGKLHASKRPLDVMLTTSQLKNPDIFKNQSYINGEWVEAKSSKRFDVVGLKNLVLPPPATANSQRTPAPARSGPPRQTTMLQMWMPLSARLMPRSKAIGK
jgi:hypothetical protein